MLALGARRSLAGVSRCLRAVMPPQGPSESLGLPLDAIWLGPLPPIDAVEFSIGPTPWRLQSAAHATARPTGKMQGNPRGPRRDAP